MTLNELIEKWENISWETTLYIEFYRANKFIADDYIGLQIRDFKRNNITFEQFLQRIQYHKGITFF